MAYPKPNEIHNEPVLILKMSAMQAGHLLNVITRTKCESSSENGHIKMTIEDIENEFKRLRQERQ